MKRMKWVYAGVFVVVTILGIAGLAFVGACSRQCPECKAHNQPCNINNNSGALQNYAPAPQVVKCDCPPLPKPAPVVAFSVSSSVPHKGNGETFAISNFDKVYVDEAQGAFNRWTGKFTCRVPGLYFFSFTILSSPHKNVNIKLMKNNERQTVLYAQSPERKMSLGTNLLLMLEKNDEVFLMHGGWEGNAMEGWLETTREYTNTFSGYLMTPTPLEADQGVDVEGDSDKTDDLHQSLPDH